MTGRAAGMRTKTPHVENGKGFTLIEVLIAIFLLIVALVGLASVTVSVIKGNDLSKMVTTATTRAKDKMEALKNAGATGYTTDPLSVGSHTDPVEAPYTLKWEVEAVGTTPPDNDTDKMKKITVTVSWRWNGHDHKVELPTIISNQS